MKSFAAKLVVVLLSIHTVLVLGAATGYTDLQPLSSPGLASPSDATAATIIRFENLLDTDIDVYWMDYDGNANFYFTVAPGGDRDQDTFAGHIWEVDYSDPDAATTMYGTYRAIKKPGRVVVQ